MGKATNPKRERRQSASDDLRRHGEIERNNGVDRNLGGSPLVRWQAANKISPTQELAINHCLELWRLAGIKPAPVTAGYGERISGSSGHEPEWLTIKIHDAKIDIARIQARFPKTYWQVFENCIRHDEPSGRAGSRIMGWSDSAATTMALACVCQVADSIAIYERLVI